jgi:hypothetical protein
LFFVAVHGTAIDRIFPACSKNKIMSMEQEISVLPLPNVYDAGHGHICTGSISVPAEQPLHVRINTLLMSYFTSEFNMDLTTEYPASLACQDIRPSLASWAKHTEENPLFGIGTEVQYTRHRTGTFAGLLTHMGWTPS